MKLRGRGVPVVADYPKAVVRRAADYLELVPHALAHKLKILGYIVVQDVPANAVVLERHRLRAAGLGMQRVPRSVRFGVGRQLANLARRHVHLHERRRVARAAVRHVKPPPIRVETERVGGQVVFGAYLRERLPAAGVGRR